LQATGDSDLGAPKIVALRPDGRSGHHESERDLLACRTVPSTLAGFVAVASAVQQLVAQHIRDSEVQIGWRLFHLYAVIKMGHAALAIRLLETNEP
jgi:hypothetical protein